MARLQPRLRRTPPEQASAFHALTDLDGVADLLEIRPGDLIWVLYRSGQRDKYREFLVPRKHGKPPRVIHAPPPSLRILQQKLATVLAGVYRPRPSASGFIRGRSIRTNAIQHIGKRLVLNIDLENFFPSINFGRVYGLLQAVPYSLPKAVATVLSQLCCREGKLPQGAPTSPIVSNMICRRMDSELQRLATSNGAWYTRYADDITFSTWKPSFGPGLVALHPKEEQPLALGDALRECIKSNGFTINNGKVRLAGRARRQTVTGITVNDFPNIDRRFIRHVRAVLHDWEVRGEAAASKSYKSGRSRNPSRAQPTMRHSVRGKLAFIRMVKGISDPVYVRLWNRYARLAGLILLPIPPPPDASPEWRRWSRITVPLESAVAFLEVAQPGKGLMHGTAFRVSPGVFLTCRHNKPNGSNLTLWLGNDAVKVEDDNFLGHPDDRIDVALIKVAEPASFSAAILRLSADLLVKAEPIMALGYPTIAMRHSELHNRPGFFAGVFEGRNPDFDRVVEFLTLDIKNSGGMSGSPILNDRGEVVAMMAGNSADSSATDAAPQSQYPQAIPVVHLGEVVRARMGG